MSELYSVTELAETLGMTPRAIRFYEDKGLIAPQRAGKNRVYTSRDRGRLLLIQRGKRLGFTLAEIGEWLNLYDSDAQQGKQMRRLLELARERITLLEAQQRDIQETLQELYQIQSDVLAHLGAEDTEVQAAG